jgi:hypothetical protein
VCMVRMCKDVQGRARMCKAEKTRLKKHDFKGPTRILGVLHHCLTQILIRLQREKRDDSIIYNFRQ